jgi:menaquinone-9 beta-reductase
MTAWDLSRHSRVLEAGLRASTADQRVFDDLVELGLARGRITTSVARGLVRELAGGTRSGRRIPPHHSDNEEPPACAS